MEGKRVKVKKVDDTKFSGSHPNNINVGYEKTGVMVRGPKVGEPFWLGSFYTSTVVEIISTKRFRTNNSVYEIEVLKDEPDLQEKIETWELEDFQKN